MIQKLTVFVLLTICSILPQFGFAQDYFGSWTLDWSQVMESDETEPVVVSSELNTMNAQPEKNPVWVFSSDSLKVYQGGSLISTAEIRWTRDNRFEIIDSKKKKNPVHYIDLLEDGKIKMRTGYSDAEIYLRRLN